MNERNRDKYEFKKYTRYLCKLNVLLLLKRTFRHFSAANLIYVFKDARTIS